MRSSLGVPSGWVAGSPAPTPPFPLRFLSFAARRLHQDSTAISSVTGETAMSTAQACTGSGCPGGSPVATTTGSATGSGSSVAGVSQVGSSGQACLDGPSNTSAFCVTLATQKRTDSCVDVAPDSNYTCAEQKQFGKCNETFIFRDAYCLRSCDRCGESCYDALPWDGFECTWDNCNSTHVLEGPFCLKTCKRCTTAAY